MAADQRRGGPANDRDREHGEREDEERHQPRAVLVPRRPVIHGEWRQLVEAEADHLAVLDLGGDPLVTRFIAPDEGRDLDPLSWPAVEPRERHLQPTVPYTQLHLPRERRRRAHEVRLRAPRTDPAAGHHRGMLGRRRTVYPRAQLVRSGKVPIGEIAEERDAHRTRRAALSGAVERDVEADPFLHEQVQRAVEVFRIAEVPDHLSPVDVSLEEAQLHPVERRQQGEWRVVHHPRSCGLQDGGAVIRTVREMRDHEAPHVFPGGGHRARRRRPDDLEPRRRPGGDLVAPGHQRCERGRQRLAEGGVRHGKGREDVPFDVRIEWLARDALHDVAGERCAVVRVGRRRAGRMDPRRRPLLQQRVV